MGTRNAERTLANDYVDYQITIPAGNSAPKSITTMLATATTATTMATRSIASFAVGGCTLDFYRGRNLKSDDSDLTAPYWTVGSYENWEPPICSKRGLDNTYIMSATGGAATTATLTIYIGDREF